jgi:hypothetical protein
MGIFNSLIDLLEVVSEEHQHSRSNPTADGWLSVLFCPAALAILWLLRALQTLIREILVASEDQ